MSSWGNLLSRLILFPIDIMQLITRQFLFYSRAAYGRIFARRAIKPPPSEETSSDVSSCIVDIEHSNAITSTTAFTRKSDIELLSAANPMNSSSEIISGSVAAAAVVDHAMGLLIDNKKKNDASLNKKRCSMTTMGKGERVTVQNEVGKDNNAETCNKSVSELHHAVQSDCPHESKLQKLSSRREDSSVASASISVTIPEKDTRKHKKRAKKGNKKESEEIKGKTSVSGNMGRISPNFFIAVQISDKEIVDKVIQLQKTLSEKPLSPTWHGLSSTEIFKDAMVPVTKLHFTLHVMHLDGEETIEKAKSAFMQLCLEIENEFKSNPFDITIEGLGHFKSSVIFAQIKNEAHVSRLTKWSELMKSNFSDDKMPSDPRPFKPHLTIAKISRSNKLHKRKIRSFPPDICTGCEDIHFGTQRVKGLQLLYMAGEDKLTGYYRYLAQHDFD